ncbi:MAG: isoleucine--tRNA ligase [Oscillospiraceae bacterium]|nr:isoleucine--tRNA ligase [Oscillospiraceae bacterium]
MSSDYNATILLPKTDFSMRAGLPKKEPELLASFYEKEIYEKLMKKNEGKPSYILHDGPPFSNGDIHIGTAMNKTLKDIIVRHKNMTGYQAPYTPGWDNHGMPIESAIIKKNKLDRKKMSIPEFRNACHVFADDYVDRQREQFKRLGVIGDWGNPYLTMAPSFEAKEVRVFGKMYEKGYINKGLKPVYWCPNDETALAEAEIEYADVPCKPIFVKFKITDSKGVLDGVENAENAYVLIWTTTAWTLPGNVAISMGGKIEYSLCRVGDEIFVVASELAKAVFEKAGIEKFDVIKKLPGSAFERVKTRHPFYDRDSLVILGDHVTVEAGTGCVHTAPGHGADDFNVCRNYKELPMFTPVDSRGIMTEEALQYEGHHYSKVVDIIIEDLRKSGALFAEEEIVHSYPHCWRCKKPIIFRATEQWFASVDAMKEAAIKACEEIEWIPKWGKERMIAMLAERSDWCISRQRHWGLPIPVFHCETCDKPICTPETIDIVAELFGEKGSNAWYEMETHEILPAGFTCPHCSASKIEKGSDTLDCWFDSGSTHAGVLSSGVFKRLSFPADLYIEGNDQYRGWFQSSMLTSIVVNGAAPYKRVITHGWTVDGEGKAMHKSLGNTVAPEEIIKEYGADILRLWVASSDYKVDTRVSKNILKQLSDIYLKIRNTARYILGNLNEFDVNALVPAEKMPELDRWALSALNRLIVSVRASYDRYEYHTIYHAIHNFCAVDMSNFYLDIIKDRLYCNDKNGLSRRSAQSTIYIILDALVRMLAPLLAFTTEEIWNHMPHHEGVETDSVLLNQMPESMPQYSLAPEREEVLSRLKNLRDDVNKALEIARTEKENGEKTIGKSLDADVEIYLDVDAKREFPDITDTELADLLIVSSVKIYDGKTNGYEGVEFGGATIVVKPSEDAMCSRCWKHDKNVGTKTDHPTLCPRCHDVVINAV